MDQKWGKGLFLSAFAHAAIISFLLFMPESIQPRRIKSPVYEVDLVELPDLRKTTSKATIPSLRTRLPEIPKKAVSTKRILSTQQDEKPVVIAKRVLEQKTQEERPKVLPTRIIDETLVRTETDTRPEHTIPLDQAISKRDSSHMNQGVRGTPSDQPANGIIIRFYQMQVENIVKSNWSYPPSLRNPGSNKDLMAIVVLIVKSDGEIKKTSFKRRSTDAIFDEWVLKAIERSNPLPPFPDGYRKTFDEIEINFNLSDLERE